MSEVVQSSLSRPRRTAFWAIVTLVALALGGLMAAAPQIERVHLERAGAEDATTLQLATQVLRGALARTQALPALLAERPILTQLLADPDNEGLVPFTNELLRQAALSLDVSDIYVMDVTGRTVASSNYRAEHSFLGEVFDFRPYFTDAMAAGLGRFHALGTTSGQRGYFFAAPILDGTEIVGVVAVKLTLDGFEQTWAESASHILVTDVNNVIFLSDRADWHFRTIGALPGDALDQIVATRQYPTARLVPLDYSETPLAEAMNVFTAGGEQFIAQTDLIAAPGWRVKLLTPTAPALRAAWALITQIALVIVLLGLVAFVVLGRRARMIERLEAERSQALLLEARVAERTRALADEVEERRATEARLRATQAELVQAGKLAALGQMSAALSHEFNQPLAAVKSYAENAAAFLDRGEGSEARENVSRISALADRMAAISRHLRNFARRPQDKTGPVPLRPVVEDALELMAPRLRAAHVTFPEGPEVWARGGRVRLQQVVVNLIGNALDAMETAPRIDITLQGGPTPRIAVRDHGPGLCDAALRQAFDPFFTTKGPGEGLGLGLSISYNIIRDFGGTLSAENHPEGGAVFTVTLDAVEAPDMPDVPEVAAE